MNIDNLTLGEAKDLVRRLLPLIEDMSQPEKQSRQMDPKNEVAVVVTTEHRGVFFGYTLDGGAKTISLRAARNCIYWDAPVKGFLGLASNGPSSKSRVGPPADIFLHGVTCVALCTPKAVEAWEAQPWSS